MFVVALILAVAVIFGFVVWRPLKLIFLARRELEAEARIFLKTHGRAAPAIIREMQRLACQEGNPLGEARWSRVGKIMARMTRDE